MFWNCSVWSCQSDLSTQIDGRQIKFYPYPKDKSLQDHWKNVCKKVSHVKDNNFFRLCELHFEKRYITRDLRLKPRAIPTIFDLPNKRKFQQTPQSGKRKSKGPPTKKIKEEPNSSLEVNQDSSLLDKKDKKKSQKSSMITPTVNNLRKTSIDSKKIVRYRLVIDIEKIQSTVQKNGENINENQKSVVKHFSDASEKRKRKEEKEEEEEKKKEAEQADQEEGKEEKIIDKIEIEDEENFEYFDFVPETNRHTQENSNDYQKEEKQDENLRFLGQNSKNESYQNSLQSSDSSLDEEDYEAEYLKFSDDEDKLKPSNASYRKEEYLVFSNQSETEEIVGEINEDRLQTSLHKDAEEEFMIISDDDETIETNQKKLQTTPQQEDRKKYFFSNSNKHFLQNSNQEDHREKINKHDDEEEEEEEEMEAEYLIYSDNSETNENITEPRNNSQEIKSSDLPTNSTDKRCKKGCALKKETCDKNTQFRCINCNNIYNVTNKSNQEISNSIYCLDKEIEFIPHSTKLILSESKVSMKLLAEHLIFTNNGNIQPCGGNCELTRIIYDNSQNYKCEKCGNIYRNSIQSVVQLPYSDDESVIKFNDIYPDIDDCDDSEDDDVSSNFWDDDSASDAVDVSKEDLSETEPLKEKKKNHLNDKNITKKTECKNGCQFTKITLNGGTIIKCIKCKRNYELEEKNKLEINLLKISDEVLQKYEDKLSKEENNDEKKIGKTKKRAKDLLKALQDKTKNVNDMMRVLKNSKKVSNLLQMQKEKIRKTANLSSKLKNKQDLSNVGNKSKEIKNLLRTSNSQKEKKTEVPKNELKKKIDGKLEKIEKKEEAKTIEKKVENQIKITNSICLVNEIIDLEEENVENYPCDICDLPFETRDLVKDHIFTMHGIKPEVLWAPFETPDCKSISIENQSRPRIV
ncbi:uncharacterized protein DDB_G0283697-like isoform X2 [Leptopilina heterotoma]|uniref:uncharacterized protein DDB_G0283697-like isoform X2 n=1 Tax=Leptopilina heterotoma TaxID=63436 RepID=UPI001CA800B4|nr:uncharacterized protein DDB_G0283697-like isoform X2 [Leptopilina heterotoma]